MSTASVGVTPVVESLGEGLDPAEVCERFLDLPYLLFLDSAVRDPVTGAAQHLGRYSFLCADPARVVRSKGRVTEVSTDAGAEWTPVSGDALDMVRKWIGEFAAEPISGLPPFQGGAAGYVGYDYGAVLERLPRARYDDLAIPDVMLGLYDWVIAWDHLVGAAWLISTGLPETGAAREHRARVRADLVRQWLVGRGRRRCSLLSRAGR